MWRRGEGLGPAYRNLWLAGAMANLGDGVGAVAYPWLASAVTRHPVEIALVGVATRLPWLVFTLPAGVITDRVDRRKLIALMDGGRAVLTLTVALVVVGVQARLPDPAALAAGTASPPAERPWLLALLYGSALLFGMAEVLRDNAAQTLMPALVRPDQLERANGRLWGAEMVMNSLVGPPLGGVLVAVALAVPFFLHAGSFGLAAVLVFVIAGAYRPGDETHAGRRPAWRREIGEGVSWLWRHDLLRVMGLVLGVMNAMFSMATATFVLFAQEVLGLGAGRFGVLLTAGAVGGVVGSLSASRVARLVGSGPSLFLTLAGSMVTLAVTGLTSSAPVVWVATLVAAFLAVLWNVITVSLRQTIIPDRLLGRVNSVYRLFAWGMIPVGTFLGGAIVELVEPLAGRIPALRAPFLLAAAVYLVLLVVAIPRLSTQRIEEARAAAQPG